MRKVVREARLVALFFLLSLSSFAQNTVGFTVDSTTSGGWLQSYGGGGYLMVAGPANWPHPGWNVNGANEWVWTRATGLPQALVYPDTRGGMASCWYSETSFTVTFPFSDQREHRVAFYFVDWDMNGRVQLVERLDPVGHVIERTELRDFQNGKYLVFTATGEIRLRFTRLAGMNAVVSGVFLDGPLNDAFLPAPPILQPNGGTFQGSVDVEMIAPSEGSHVFFTVNGNDPAFEGVPYTGPINITQSMTIRAVARNSYGPGTETRANFNILPASATAEFLGPDTNTLGNWMGNYGYEGFFITMFAPSIYPINHNATLRWIWNWSTTDPSALQKPTSPGDRVAACWYTNEQFTMSVPIGRDTARIVSVYALDWDGLDRVQRIEVLDTATGLVLDSQVASNFVDGVYFRWRVWNDVTLRVTRLEGPNAVLSGLFIDPGSLERVSTPAIIAGGPPGQPPTVEISSGTSGASVRYTLDGTTPTMSSRLYSGPFQLTFDAQIAAIAFKEGMLPSAMSTATIDVDGGLPAAAVEFVTEDSLTQGSWRGQHGAEGYWVVGDWTVFPDYFDAKIFGTQEHIWAFNVGDLAALEKSTSAGRIAACRYAGNAFTVVVDQADTNAREVSLYFLDWDEAGRVQKVEVLDRAGTVLDSRTVSDFGDGKYLTWRMTGEVTIRLTRLEGPNAVLSGIFVDLD